ncbi:MAG: DNA primase [Gammaproteobacteria bacterium]|nr:DNA primase [Gammaproteobacteria bacterium]
MAGRIPQQFIDELLTRVDVVEVIDARVPLRKAGREYTACCPFHDEKTPSFTVSPDKQFYYCFGCGAHGTALGFLIDYEHLDFIEAVQELAARVGMEVPRTSQEAVATPAGAPLYGVLEQAAAWYRRQLREHPEAGRAVEYLKGRGLTGTTAADYGIGFAPAGWDNLKRATGAEEGALVQLGLLIKKDEGGTHDRFRNRIMFPIHDARGRVIGFGGRVIDAADDAQGRASVAGSRTPEATNPKYLNSPESVLFHKGRELYGLYQARKAVRALTRLLVVEGYMDVVMLAQHGIHNAVATLGTATTHEHMERLFRVVPEVVFCFDGDRAGREAAWRALINSLPLMRDGRQIGFLFLPEGEDPDSLVQQEGSEAFLARATRPVPLSEFFYEGLMAEADISSMDGRARLVELARPLLAKLAPGAFQHMMVARLAELVRIDAQQLARMLAAGKPPATAPDGRQERYKRVSAPPTAMSQARLVIALLLSRPSLAAQAGDPQRFAGLEVAGAALLQEMLELLHQHPHLSPAALLEHWRDTEQGRQLMKLAQWRHPVPEEGVEAEFRIALERLYTQGLEQRKERLIDKAHQGQLSAEEKQEMAAWTVPGSR